MKLSNFSWPNKRMLIEEVILVVEIADGLNTCTINFNSEKYSMNYRQFIQNPLFASINKLKLTNWHVILAKA